ncbi:MAG TPA: tetratricopeptide repeat protein [Vicinamibacterales bacterium]|nr:tetratricopeptide repeat protein [Vicinamibacterales bacterium]
MASDRAESVKKAEKLLRQGKLDLAIAEYVRMVDEQPRDWNLRNTLGDLYVRASQLDKAVAQYLQIADHLFNEGFFSKAAALYKKILKIKPDEESVLLHLAEISAKQGLLADAKGYFVTVAGRRKARGDRAGADEITVRLGSLDPADFDARALAASTLEQNGDLPGAAALYRAMHADLVEKNRRDEATQALREAVRLNPDDVAGRAELVRAAIAANDREAAARYLDRRIAADDPSLLLPLLESELRAGRLDEGREILQRLLQIDRAGSGRIVETAWNLGPVSPDASYVCVDAVVEAEIAAGNFMDAAAILQEFVTRVPGQIAALLKLVEIAVDGGLEAIMYEAQAHLADAYLERGQGSEARVIAEDLVAREPWEGAHIDRFRRALVLLQVADPDTVIADRLSGQGPFIATDPFMASESFTDDLPLPPIAAPAPTTPAAEPAAAEVPEPDTSVPPPDPEPEAPAAARPSPPDVDLTDMLSELGTQRAAAPPLPSSQNLEAVFKDIRSAVAKQAVSSDAAEYLSLGKAYVEMGMAKEAISALRAAARAPMLRFEAASTLGRVYLKQGDVPHAIEWLERAAEAPAPDPSEACELLYELGSILEDAGETSRALAVFLELQADAPGFRDVAARAERLARVQAGS